MQTTLEAKDAKFAAREDLYLARLEAQAKAAIITSMKGNR